MTVADLKVNRTIHGDALKILKRLPDESIDMIITSPPYWSLRDYEVQGQIGIEKTYREYIDRLCTIFDEARRVLKQEGTCWVNMGDTYGTTSGSGIRTGMQASNRGTQRNHSWQEKGKTGVKGMEKCLLQISARFAIAMCDRGWILRNEIIWHKPNAMPSSATDRFTVDFEKLFFFTKNKGYYFEAQYEPYGGPLNRWGGMKINPDFKTKTKQYAVGEREGRNMRPNPNGRNKRCVWKINTRPFSEAHFAVYPPELIETPIKAGCPELVCKKCGKARTKIFRKSDLGRDESGTKYDTKGSTAGRLAQRRQAYRKMGLEGPPAKEFLRYSDCECGAGYRPGIVLDPFMGSGTTAIVARELGRDYLGIELNDKYIAIAEKRMKQDQLTLWQK